MRLSYSLEDRIGDRSAETAVPRRVDFAGMPQMPPVEIGPERVEKDKLRVSGLPEQEIRQPLLARGTDPQVDVGDFRLFRCGLSRRTL